VHENAPGLVYSLGGEGAGTQDDMRDLVYRVHPVPGAITLLFSSLLFSNNLFSSLLFSNNLFSYTLFSPLMHLPESLQDFIFDFGTLSKEQEALYVKSMCDAVISPLQAKAKDFYTDSTAELEFDMISSVIIDAQVQSLSLPLIVYDNLSSYNIFSYTTASLLAPSLITSSLISPSLIKPLLVYPLLL